MKPCIPVPKKPPWLTAVNCSLFRPLPKPVGFCPVPRVRAATAEKSLYLPGHMPQGGTSARGKPRWLCLPLPTGRAETPVPRAQQPPGRHTACRQHRSISLCNRMSLPGRKHLAFLRLKGLLPFCCRSCPWGGSTPSAVHVAARGLPRPAMCQLNAAALRCAWVACTATEY